MAKDASPYMTPAEVGGVFRVDAKTVSRWARRGRLSSVRTLGGHRRYLTVEVMELLAASQQERKDEGHV